MSEWAKLILMLVGAVVGSSALTAFVTLYFTRQKTDAETRSIDADANAKRAEAHKTDAEAQRTEADTMRAMYAEIRSAIGQWADCTKELGDSRAENGQLKVTIELLRQENVLKDKTITELHGRTHV